MKRRREPKEKETWEDFEKRVGLKRTGGEGRAERHGKVPVDILVQRMSSTPSGRLKKYEPLDTRDFVPFSEYDDLTLENIKEACERYYKAPAGSYDVLASDRGPSCSKLEQIKGKKVYFIRFLPPKDEHNLPPPLFASTRGRAASLPVSPTKLAGKQITNNLRRPKTVFPKSVSIGDLLKAGKLVKPPATTTLLLEEFHVENSTWIKSSSVKLEIGQDKFASGAFRDAFRAKCTDQSSVLAGDWVVKKYQEGAIATIEDVLKMEVEDHTRKQVQMNAVARSITARFSSKVPAQFGETFSYGKVFYSQWDDLPVTVEEYVPGVFQKYINNDGQCIFPDDEIEVEVFNKAQRLSHFSYVYSEKKMMILDIQGAMYNLYDPEIVTKELHESSDSTGESYFCAGNLSSVAIDKFLYEEHVCNEFCEMMDIK